MNAYRAFDKKPGRFYNLLIAKRKKKKQTLGEDEA
jgi:hypothetical protein